jgi:curved DNA-binding protein CbpA
MNDIYAYYRILGLRLGVSVEEIEKSYRTLLKELSEKCLSLDPQAMDEIREKIVELNTAYEKVKVPLLNYHQRVEQFQSSRFSTNHMKKFSLLLHLTLLLFYLFIAFAEK